MPSGEKLDISSLRCRAVRSLQSGLSRINREILACFAYFEGKGGSISLQSRLRGGAERIRPLGTGLKPVRADVCASYPESGALRILCDCVLAAQSSLTGGFPKEFEGESLAILWLKVVTSKLLNRPGCIGV